MEIIRCKCGHWQAVHDDSGCIMDGCNCKLFCKPAEQMSLFEKLGKGPGIAVRCDCRNGGTSSADSDHSERCAFRRAV